MPNVRFNIDINATETYFQNGKDSLQFLFSANKGTDFGLLKKLLLVEKCRELCSLLKPY
jgi:DNA repair protein RecN (Recombination protein N)